MDHSAEREGTEATEATGSVSYRTTVRAEWIDYNGHMNVAYYGLVFDLAADAVLAVLDLGESYRTASGCSIFVRESHLVFDREVGVGAELSVDSRVLDADDRRLTLFQEMRSPDEDGVVATCEVLCVHVDLATRRSCSWPAAAARAVVGMQERQRGMCAPERAGRAITLSRRPSARQD